jgi:hypothetical protein
LYAQHWAEMNGEPEAPVREQLVERYGEQVRNVSMILRHFFAGI